MYKNSKNGGKESGKMMALTVASMNLLIMTVLITSIWFIYSLLDKADRLNDLTRGFQLMP